MPEKIIRVGQEYYILATSALADDRTRVLKHGETFGVFNRYGDIQPIGLGEQGIYHEGTRFLSRLEFTCEGMHPLLLSSTVKQDNALFTVDLSNPDLTGSDGNFIPRGTLHFSRSMLLWQSCWFEQLLITNYGMEPVPIAFSFAFEADYADIFEVRGLRRARRGNAHAEVLNEETVVMTYTGLDGVVRRTRLHVAPRPTAIAPSTIGYRIQLQPKERATILLTVSCESLDSPVAIPAFSHARTAAAHELQVAADGYCSIFTANEQVNDWINRSFDDLCMMTTDTPVGPYPYAGVPWFSTAFGRDGLITALETLSVNPDLARGVLGYLATTQARELVPEQDAEPGKILHETRKGEMAALGEIPFARYYGSVDATPLFVMLAGAYYERTGDRHFASILWPNVDLALEWMDRYGDRDGDGFVEYDRQSKDGLVQQGWKDSHDSIFHADGTLAKGPLALCEVQGYVYAARLAAARLAEVLGYPQRAEALRCQADTLRARFDQAFWSDEIGGYVLALDGDKRPCRVRASNMGHCLFTEIATPDHGRIAAETLMEEPFFSGWGIRTLAKTEVRYNPMSYHNGSVWPHDNALIAYGLSRYRSKEAVHRILAGLLDMSLYVELHRLPELVCGFDRRMGEGPTLYPVACAPQSWAAASVFLLLQACLGLSMHGPDSEIRFTHPLLPEFLERVQIKNLRVGGAVADVSLGRHGPDVEVTVLRKEGNVDIVIVK